MHSYRTPSYATPDHAMPRLAMPSQRHPTLYHHAPICQRQIKSCPATPSPATSRPVRAMHCHAKPSSRYVMSRQASLHVMPLPVSPRHPKVTPCRPRPTTPCHVASGPTTYPRTSCFPATPNCSTSFPFPFPSLSFPLSFNKSTCHQIKNSLLIKLNVTQASKPVLPRSHQ